MPDVTQSPGAQSLSQAVVRRRWLADHDVHTEFFDAGIGCCWFAQKGDGESVTGETESEAIARLSCFTALAATYEV
jgi:hypothetical protein